MVSKKITLLMLFAVVIISMAFYFSTDIPGTVFAQDRALEIDYPDIGVVPGPTTVATGLPEYIRYIFNFVIAFAGIILLYALIKGGSMYLTAAGSVTAMTAARSQISSAFLGIIILLGSYIILTTINPGLVIFEEFTLDSLFRKAACEDGKDNDGDGKTDFPNDPGCTSKNDENEADFEADADSVIFYEIPVGQMIKNGVWKTDLVAEMADINESTKEETGLLVEFEEFLTKEIVAGGKTSKSVSGLNKYLRSLAETCNCDDLIPICTKQENFAQDIGCVGDPCYENRQKIEDIIDVNSEKIAKLDDYKTKLEEKLSDFFDEQDKFFNNQEKFQNCLETGFLMTQGDYLQSVRYYEELGITTEVVQSYVPSRGDPFTFYCTVGGTTFDIPVNPQDLPPIPVAGGADELNLPTETVAFQPLSCPGVIPIEMIVSKVVYAAVASSDTLINLTASVNGLVSEINSMKTLISQCNQESCKGEQPAGTVCNCFTNPCYIPGTPPLGTVICPTIPGSPCQGTMCASPCLQTIGVCKAKNNDPPFNGSACPLYKDPVKPGTPSIEGSLERIKIYEDTILESVKELKDGFLNAPYIIEGPEEISADLVSAVNWVMGFCKNTDIENPTWAMLNCSLALGNIGPDGKPIGSCNIGDFFCCAEQGSYSQKLIDQPSDAYGTPMTGGQYAAATNYTGCSGPPVISDGTCNDRIIAQAATYAGISYSQKEPFCGHCCLPARDLGAETVRALGGSADDLDCSGFVSRVYRDLGIIESDSGTAWCRSTVSLVSAANACKNFRIIDPQYIQKGDLIVSWGKCSQRNANGKCTTWQTNPQVSIGDSDADSRHAVLFADDNPANFNATYKIWEEGGGCSGGVCSRSRSNQSIRKYAVLRRTSECNTF